jgi:hypothetical protein
MKAERCSTCRFFYAFPNGGGAWCRRYPPQIYDVGQTNFPRVGGDDWCGEWRLARTTPKMTDGMREDLD